MIIMNSIPFLITLGKQNGKLSTIVDRKIVFMKRYSQEEIFHNLHAYAIHTIMEELFFEHYARNHFLLRGWS